MVKEGEKKEVDTLTEMSCVRYNKFLGVRKLMFSANFCHNTNTTCEYKLPKKTKQVNT